ncbi:hypothetical protein NQ317_003176 [Molorchus minor]|uniref:Uncharacterized protein n=1 Tax=Molorchus minor TaxID=1323400 RepID=A0ABQ9JBC5_9CUCU|nr:hypothetical protein NQ317_003176 [Molorchus minor]
MLLLDTRYGKAILVHLFDESANITFKSFLPKRVTEHLKADLMDKINLPEAKYTLTYLGQSQSSFGGKEKSLLKFDLKEVFTSKNMWMQYSSDTYPLVEDIKSAVQRLACQLHDLSKDSEHATNYDLSVCFNDAAVQDLLENAKTYKCGENLCHKFTEGLLNLEEFCELMYRVDLKRFLYEITGYLPEHILEQYKLRLPDDEDQSADNK